MALLPSLNPRIVEALYAEALGLAETVRLRFERLRSHLPVQVRHGGTEARAGGLDYDNLQRQLTLKGPVRAVMVPGRRSAADRATDRAPGGAAASARAATP